MTRWVAALVAAGVLAVVVIVALGLTVGRDDSPGSAATGPDTTFPPVDPSAVYDPYQAGEQIADGYFPIYARDVIGPVYNPEFVSAGEIGWPDDTDVIGVEIDGQSRAYPIGFLSGREIVNDEIAGVPILVTW